MLYLIENWKLTPDMTIVAHAFIDEDNQQVYLDSTIWAMVVVEMAETDACAEMLKGRTMFQVVGISTDEWIAISNRNRFTRSAIMASDAVFRWWREFF